MRIGILGGMFDPIHLGHLRGALEAKEGAKLNQVRFIPCAQPAHRETPEASFEQRCQMVSHAIEDMPDFILDPRESERLGPSYMVDTLHSLQQSFPRATLCLILGADAFATLPQWHQWEKIPTLAHCIVLNRPGHVIAIPPWVSEAKSHSELDGTPAGKILIQSMCALDIASSHIRYLRQNYHSPRYLVAPAVLHYIEQHHLYMPPPY